MLSIGEFSRITKLTIKSLRFYHDRGLLIPDKIDYDSKYRYYRSTAVEKARIIKKLKELGFSLKEIKSIIIECKDDQDIVNHVENKLTDISNTIKHMETIEQSLSLFLLKTKEHTMEFSEEIKEEILPELKIFSIRFKGKYPEVGEKFAMLFKKGGRFARGKPFTLYYDCEYKEEDADMEACVEAKRVINLEGINSSLLAGCKVITLIHRGPYEELTRSYQTMYEYCNKKQLKVIPPTREQYLKGPGFIFRGNPKKYVTKIMFPVQE